MTIVPFLPLVAGILSIALGLIVLFNGTTKTATRWPFMIFAGSVGVWAIFISFFILSSDANLAKMFATTYYIAALLISYGFMLFGLMHSSVRTSPFVVGLAMVPWLVVSVLILLPGIFIGGVSIGVTNDVQLIQPAYLFYAIVFCLYTLVGLMALLVHAVRTNRARSRQSRILAASLAFSIAGGGYFNLVLPGFGNYELIAWGPVFAFVMVSSVFYVIAKHGLFDIRFAVVRTVAYALSLSLLVAIYLLIANVILGQMFSKASPIEQTLLNTALTLVTALSFHPTKRFFDRLTNRLFYKDMYKPEQLYGQLNSIMTSTVKLERLLESTVSLIANALKSETAALFVYKGERGHISSGTQGYRKVSRQDLEELDTFRAPIFVGDASLATSVRRLLVSYRLSVVVPLCRDDAVIGFLCLGEHRTSQYTRRDLRTLGTVAGELVIGIQNALSIQEVRDVNDNLEQRIIAATKELRASNAQLQKLDEAKDEFISMASHQLRTPLTSIKGYISMLLEGDLGELTTQQKHTLREAFVSSERMVRLIGDFLNVSRLQTGKFVVEKRPVDFVRLVARELEALEQSAGARGLKFKYKHPTKLPLLNIDENKIQQVVMNFADNAIYYSKENGVITVTVKKAAHDVELTVKDTGIGVPKSEQSGLFNKFFRATNARQQRPDGTGVGLFLAKKVVQDHGGQIIFESTEGKGSTFGFRLPLPKDK